MEDGPAALPFSPLSCALWEWSFNHIIFDLGPLSPFIPQTACFDGSNDGHGSGREAEVHRNPFAYLKNGPASVDFEARALACATIASKVLLHHMPRVRAAALRGDEETVVLSAENPDATRHISSEVALDPALCFENTVLRLVSIEAKMFRFTRSEAVAESLINLLTVYS